MSFGGGSSSGGSISGSNDVALSNPSNGQSLVFNVTLGKWQNQTATAPDATASSKGSVQLAGDLGGSAASPVVAAISGVAISGTAANGSALVATSATTAGWAPTVTLDTSHIPQPLGTASPGSGTNGAATSDHVHAMPALSQLSDQDVSNLADGTIPTWSASAGKFKQQLPAAATNSSPLWQTIASGVTTLPRTHQDDSASFGSTPASGTEHFTYFRADKSITVGHIQFQTGGTAAVSSTYAAVGLYTVSGSTLTLVASCNNMTTFSGTYATQSCALTSTYGLTAGTVYAIGILQTASTPASVLGCWFNGAYMGSSPAMAATKASQSSLASSVASPGSQQFPIYYELIA